MAGLVCLLLNTDDEAGLRLLGALKKAGVKDIQLVTAEELIYAPRFCCGIKNGAPFFSIGLHNGQELNGENVAAVLNRIRYLPLQNAQQFRAEDRAYVVQELPAIFTFLFSILPGQLFNKSNGNSLNGRCRSALEWQLLAGNAGFDTGALWFEQHELKQLGLQTGSPVKAVLFFNGKCFGNGITQDAVLYQQCLALGKASGEKILEIYVQELNEGNRFLGANLVPSFQGAGADFIHELKTLL